MSASTPLATLDGVEDGTDLAVMVGDGRIEHWQWTEGVMQKENHRLPPFFFTGLLKDGKVMPGNFSPPVKGEWFAQPGSDWMWLVLKEKGDRIFRCAYFRRSNFYDWRDASQKDLIDNCMRVEAPAFATQEFVQMTDRASEENEARLKQEREYRQMRDARNNLRYARDYLDQALQVMSREGR